MESNLNVNKAEKAIKFFLLAGVSTLIIWKWSLRETFIPKPSELFFALALLGGVVYFLLLGRGVEIKKIPKNIFFVLGFIFLSVLLGTAYGYFKYGLGMTLPGAAYLLRLSVGMCLFLLFYFLLSRDMVFRRRVYAILILSPLAYIPFLFFPSLAKELSLLSGVRFTGLTQTPTTVALSLFIAFSFLFIFLLDLFLQKKSGRKFVYIAGCAALLIGLEWLIMWTWSRVYFGTIWLVLVSGTILMARYYKKGIIQTGCYLLVILVIALSAVIFSPHRQFILKPLLKTINNTRNLFSLEGGTQVLARQAVDKSLAGVPDANTSILPPAPPSLSEKSSAGVPGANTSILPPAPPSLPEINMVTPQGVTMHSRGIAQFYYFELFRRDIAAFAFGLGVNYESRFSFVTVIGDAKGVEGAESAVDILLYGGIGLAVALLLLGWIILKNMRREFFASSDETYSVVYVLAPVIAMAAYIPPGILAGVASQLYGFYFWILLAMALAPVKLADNGRLTE